jgi:hypothetical protein
MAILLARGSVSLGFQKDDLQCHCSYAQAFPFKVVNSRIQPMEHQDGYFRRLQSNISQRL